MGFEEIPHTADWSLRVWADDLPSLFAESARAMNSLSGTVPARGPRVEWTFEAEAPDPESLLVAFLSELVYAQEQENLVFDAFEVHIDGQRLRVQMEGDSVAFADKAIKAVTYHDLRIEQKATGCEVIIVFDV
jgi:SHS2 domain-containing protein